MKGYDLKIRLDKIRPIHWRDLIIPIGISFDDLYHIVQAVYGFNYEHDYKFSFKNSDIVIEGLGDGVPILYLDDLDEYYLSFSYNLGNNFLIEDFFNEKDKIKLEIYTRDKWEFIIEVKKIVEMDYSYPIIKRFKGDYNPIERGCDVYDFITMLYLLDHPEKRDDSEFSRADAYSDSLEKFDMEKSQKILQKRFENYSNNDVEIDCDDDVKIFPLEPTTLANVNSEKCDGDLIGRNEYGSVYIHKPLLGSDFKKVAVIIGMHPLESKSYRVVFKAMNLISDINFVTFYVYNIVIKEEFQDKEGVGEKIAEELILPHIFDNDYDLVIDVHSTIQKVSDDRTSHSFMFAPSNTELEESLKKLSLECNLSYFKPDNYSVADYVQKIIDYNLDLIHFETSSYDPMSISYHMTKSLIKVIGKLYLD